MTRKKEGVYYDGDLVLTPRQQRKLAAMIDNRIERVERILEDLKEVRDIVLGDSPI